VAKRKGLFITFEGPEGSGKSTHSRRLAAWLRSRGHRVVLTREPGGTALGSRLRRIFLSQGRGKMDPVVELCLVEASRAALVAEVILPALQRGDTVVLDRFQDSTWVYQGFAGRLNLKLVDAMGEAATQGLKPDLTLLLDLPARKGLRRVKRPNRMETMPLGFHRRVRSGYLALARRNRKRIKVLSALPPPQQVQRCILEHVQHVIR